MSPTGAGFFGSKPNHLMRLRYVSCDYLCVCARTTRIIMVSFISLEERGIHEPTMSSAFKPPDREVLLKNYEKASPLYQQLIEEICYILEKGLKGKGIGISDIEHRIKRFERFYGNILREEIAGDPFELVEDIAGIRIICLYRSDLPRVESLIKEKLQVTKAKVLRDESRIKFGYMSDHFVVKLPSDFRGERYDAVKGLKCEIQVRTVAMHAWATVSHHLDYKQDVDIPSHLKNDFYALSGMFYVADSLFEQFRKAREETIKKLEVSVEKKGFNLDMEMNLDTLRAYLSWKFPDREKVHRFAISMLLSEIRKARIKSYNELDRILNINMKWALQDEKQFPPYDSEKRRPTTLSNVGIVMRILRSHASI
jgi:putative GTP pyrophosphokinase